MGITHSEKSNSNLAPWGEDARRAGEGLLINFLFLILYEKEIFRACNEGS